MTSTRATTDLRRAIDETNRRFEELFNRGDIAGAARETYTRDCRVMPPGAPTVEGRDAAAAFWPAAAQQLNVTRVALTTVELTPMGDDAAYEIGRATLTVGASQATAKYLVVWREEDRRWRWHVDIWNMEG